MALNGVSEPNSRYPSAANADNSITQNGFTVTTRKLPILKAEPIEQMTKNLAIAPPEMIFGDNLVSIQHTSGWGINFNTYDALDRVDKTGGSMLQVAHSKEWQSTREKKHEGITEVVKPFDWSYSTDYKGTTQSETPAFEASTKPIPLELLKRPDPILFFDEVLLYEDEMADNGITMFSCKVRVMPQRLLLLCRFFMRLDGVLLRIRDTRVYVDFGTQEVIREYLAKEEKYETVREKLSARGQDAPAQLRDPNNLTDLLPVVEKSLESLVLR
ncbi:Tap42 interacting protein [Lecanora helva]